jgi:hypothetical protein
VGRQATYLFARPNRKVLVDLFSTVALAAGSSWLSGLNAYAVVATLGLLERYQGWQLPGQLSILSNPWVIGVAIGMYVIEFIADKIPWLDTIWDAVHTFIRIPAGALLMAGALGQHVDPMWQVLAGLVGGSLALTSHGAKSATRASVNLLPEPFTNWSLSLFEDVLAIGGSWLAIVNPWAILVLVALGLAGTFFIFKKVRQFYRKLFSRQAPR